MLWQHVFQAVVCVLSAMEHATELHAARCILQKCNFSKAQRKLPEDSPDGPKHVGVK